MASPDFQTLRIVACDLNGQMRGKRQIMRVGNEHRIPSSRMPFSALNVDLWGTDIKDSKLILETGDADGVLKPTGRGPLPMPWLANHSGLVPTMMYDDHGAPFQGDPRYALCQVLDRFTARGWQVIAATEMEFTLVDDSGDQLAPPLNPLTGRPLLTSAMFSIRQLDAFDAFFSDVYAACADMDIPAESAISEVGLGQFEINLLHQDAQKAADDAWLFKSMIRGIARRHGLAATFMAKPYPHDAGNGMHVHFSVVDRSGKNVFDNGTPQGNDLLRAAVAGCLSAMPDSTLIFAPYLNSFDRLVSGAHAPTGALWAYENRTVAIRIPGGAPAARRIEHRVAGGDINPYLMLAAVLGAALMGIEDDLRPPPPVTGNAYGIQDVPQLANSFDAAIYQFEHSELMARIFSPQLIEHLVMTKRQELRRFAQIPIEKRWMHWLENV